MQTNTLIIIGILIILIFWDWIKQIFINLKESLTSSSKKPKQTNNDEPPMIIGRKKTDMNEPPISIGNKKYVCSICNKIILDKQEYKKTWAQCDECKAIVCSDCYEYSEITKKVRCRNCIAKIVNG